MEQNVLRVVLIVSISIVCFGQSTHFVTPAPDTPCPGDQEPCHTLSEYVADGYFNNFPMNTTMQFLPGIHTLETTITLANLTWLAILGDSFFLPEVKSWIICTWPAGFVFNNITELHITALAFLSCGHENNGAITITSVLESYIFKCTFLGNYAANSYGDGGAIAAWYSTLSLAENTLQNNSAYYGGAISIAYSTSNITRNTFQDNFAHLGGALLYGSFMDKGNTFQHAGRTIAESNLTTNAFRGNSAYQGGAIFSQEVTLNLTGSNFQNNSAEDLGGAIAAVRGTLVLTTNKFQSNSAYQGGAILTQQVTLNLTRNIFQNNSAENIGGAIAVDDGTLMLNAFQGNSAHQGGAIFSQQATLSLKRNIFQSNIAKNTGGAIAADGSSLILATNSFQGNSAYQGGAVVARESILSLIRNNFQNNSAEYYGGAITANGTLIQLTTNAFQSNSAYEGGAIETFLCRGNLTMNIFRGNSAETSGGAILTARGGILNLTTNAFQSNSAKEGGAIFADTTTLSLTRNTFLGNSATVSSGAIAIYQSIFTLTNNIFQNNSAEYGGAHLAMNSTLYSSNNAFQNNTAYVGGALYAGRSSTIVLTGDTYFKNFALAIGGALAAYGSTLTFLNTFKGNNTTNPRDAAVHDHLIKVTIHSNRATYGGGLYVVNTTIIGSMILIENHATEGGAISASRGMFLLSSTTTITSNSARIGGGLQLSDDSKLYFPSDTDIHFINNTALETGGAMHIKAIYQTELCLLRQVDITVPYVSDCFFQIEVSSTQPHAVNNSSELQQLVQSLNVSMYFENNSASDAGGDLYGGLIDKCLLHRIEDKTILYNKYPYSGGVFDVIASSETTPDITSDPLRLCICKHELQNCDITYYSQSVYPGGTVEVPVIALGQRNQSTVGVIYAVDISERMTLRSFEDFQSIKKGCNTLRYTIYSHAVGTTQGMTLYADGPCSPDEKITITVTIQRCPPGFQLPRDEPHCVCTEGLQQYTDKCFVDNGTVLRQHNAEFWVGYNDDKGLILHPHCPFDYCTLKETYLEVTNSDKQCNNNRSGIMCGRCGEGLSLVFGSSRCLRCSNSYVSLLAAFALAGIALVFLLLLLRLTVAAGTINGLIFYANIVTMNSATFFKSRTSNVLRVFIAWLNLDFGIETCFYNGMDAYVKTWLQFAFPIYLWCVVGAMIVSSHYSVRLVRLLGRNPVAVLATLFLLSYAKLLRTAIAALSYTALKYPNSHIAVWLYDGNIEYLSSKHIPLFITALGCLIFLFLPYTALLIFSQWVQAKSKWRVFSWINSHYIVPFLDAYHAPYATERRYWMGLMLLLRFVLSLISAVNALGDPRINLMAVAAALALTTPAIAGIGIYKSWYLGLLEVSFLINLTALVLGTFYIYPNEDNQNAITFTSVSIAFATFTGIVIYHSIQQFKASLLWKKLFVQHDYIPVPLSSCSENEGEEDPPERVYVSGCAPTQTVVDLRELRKECEATEGHEAYSGAEVQKPHNHTGVQGPSREIHAQLQGPYEPQELETLKPIELQVPHCQDATKLLQPLGSKELREPVEAIEWCELQEAVEFADLQDSWESTLLQEPVEAVQLLQPQEYMQRCEPQESTGQLRKQHKATELQEPLVATEVHKAQN